MSEWTTVELNRINYLTNEIDAAYHEAARKLHLSDSALLILYTICNHGDGCLLYDICRLSGASKQTINSALRKLEAEGMVYLEMSGSKHKTVCFTEQGRALADRTAGRVMEAEDQIFASWTKEEVETYLGLTEAFARALKEKAEEMEGHA